VRISAKVDYAVRAAVEIAASHPNPVKRDQIAEVQDVPPKYLEAILTELRNARLIQSQRGADGGHKLARPASEISIADIVRAVDGPLASIQGNRPENLNYEGRSRALQLVWVALRTNIRMVLEGVTLRDLAEDDLPGSIVELTTDPEDWLSH
jgi:Rrf2 family protein